MAEEGGRARAAGPAAGEDPGRGGLRDEGPARGKFYVTTPIYYPSASLHIGHAYTTVAADVLARFHRLRGEDVFFLTGTDEHGQKIQRKAEAAGKHPREFVDGIVAGIKHLWERLRISYDDFIRTTEERHKGVVQRIFERLRERGDIYKAEYEGWYCTDCESFYTETQYQDFPGGRCPDHDKPLERLREESYFFRMSRYADALLRHIEENPDFIQPPSRRNEMVNFIKQGLEDLCVSRTSFDWGVRVPFDPRHVVYVWVDALSNYISAIGYLSDDPKLRQRFERYWPADVHLVGKEIVRFHTVIWPILLMALELPLPRRVFGHGWLVLESGKMSKARGNVIDPHALMDRYGVDAVRYFLVREIPFGADGFYSEEALVARYNADLANDLGNLLSRSTAMVERFLGGIVPDPAEAEDDGVLRGAAEEAARAVEEHMERLELSDAAAAVLRLAQRANKYIDETAPWELARDPLRLRRLGGVLYSLLEAQRVAAVLLTPFLVEAPEKIWHQLGLDGDVRAARWPEDLAWGGLSGGARVRRGAPLFPRVVEEAEGAAGGGG